jgi:Tfp pilus assembly protein PilF
MVTHALEQNPNAFWMWLFKARLQEKLGDKSGAVASSQQSLKLATEQGNDDYIKMNNELLQRLK